MLIYAAYNAQGSRGIIVAEQVGAVKRSIDRVKLRRPSKLMVF
jgi:hypothetical protein